MASEIQMGGKAGEAFGKGWQGVLDDAEIIRVRDVVAPEAAGAAGLDGYAADEFARGFMHGWRAALRDRRVKRVR